MFFLGVLLAVTGYLFYLENPQPTLLSLILAGLGFIVSSIAGVPLGKLTENIWARYFHEKSFQQDSKLWPQPNFEEVFNVGTVDDLEKMVFTAFQFVNLREQIASNIKGNFVLFLGPSGVGKTREAIEYIKQISLQRSSWILTPRRYPIIVPNSIPEYITKRHIIVYLDDVYRIYRARDTADWDTAINEIISFFGHYSDEGYTIVATLRDTDYSKAYYPGSKVWRNISNKVSLDYLSEEQEERLVEALAKQVQILVLPSQRAQIAKINPGTCTDLINYFIEKRTEKRRQLSDEDIASFRPDYWNKKIFPQLPQVVRLFFHVLALFREIGVRPLQQFAILFSLRLAGGSGVINLRVLKTSIKELVAKGILNVDNDSIFCHDSYLDGKVQPLVDVEELTKFLLWLCHPTILLLLEKAKLIIAKNNILTDRLNLEAQYAILQIADYLWQRNPQRSIEMLSSLKQYIKSNSIAGLLLQTILKWHRNNETLITDYVFELYRSKNMLCRKSALVLARQLDIPVVLSKASKEFTSEMRRFGAEQVFYYWVACMEYEKTSNLEKLCDGFLEGSTIPILLLPKPAFIHFMSIITGRLGIKYFGIAPNGLRPLLRCWQKAITVLMFGEEKLGSGARNRSLRLNLITWLVSLQLRKLLSNSLRPDHIVNVEIINSWFRLPINERVEWTELLRLTEPETPLSPSVKQEIIDLAHDKRPLFGVLAVPAIVSLLGSHYHIAIEIISEIFRSEDLQAWTIALRGMLHGVELGMCQKDQILRLYDLARRQVLRMWEQNTFREARFDTIGWPMLLEIYSENDIDRIDFALDLANRISETDAEKAIKKLDLIKSVSGAGFDGYSKAAITTLESWYPWDEPMVRAYMINTITSLRNFFPQDVDASISRPETPIELKKAYTTISNEYPTKEIGLNPAGSLLIALFKVREVRSEWLGALSNDLLNSKNFSRASRKFALRLIKLIASEQTLDLLPNTLERSR